MLWPSPILLCTFLCVLSNTSARVDIVVAMIEAVVYRWPVAAARKSRNLWERLSVVYPVSPVQSTISVWDEAVVVKSKDAYTYSIKATSDAPITLCVWLIDLRMCKTLTNWCVCFVFAQYNLRQLTQHMVNSRFASIQWGLGLTNNGVITVDQHIQCFSELETFLNNGRKTP